MEMESLFIYVLVGEYYAEAFQESFTFQGLSR